MSLSSLSAYTFKSRYAKYNPKKRRRENWGEVTDRVFEMHARKFEKELKNPEFKEAFDFAKQMMKEKRVFGSQRALQYAIDPIFHHNSRLYNCCATYIDRTRAFAEVFYMLLSGCGVGFSVQKRHVNKLPFIGRSPEKVNGTKTFIIPDTIEGWSDAIDELMNHYFVTGYNYGTNIKFDYSQIRPQGAHITGGFKAPGPEPLKKSIELITEMLDKITSEGGRQLRPIEVYDIIMHIADAVISGGVRRSACITLFDKDDEEMVNSKSEAFWWEKHPQRMRSNNSVVLKRDEITKEEFDNIFERTKNFGEPGFVFVSDYNNLVNPCAEISLRPALFDDNGEIIASGFSCCNLTEIIASKCETEEDFYKACRASAIIGTMQATYTSFPYLGKVTEEIAKRDALLGCSITGFMDKPELFFNPDIQRKGAEIVKDTNIKIAKLLNIRPARRATTVKPSGTTSILGKTGSGIHPHHAKRYIRRVQAVKNEFCYNFFKAYNPHAIEENVIGSRDGRTGAILFPCEVPSGSITKNQLPAIEFLKHIRLTQDNWIKYGVNKDLCDKNDKNLAHNVSNTVVVRPEEWEEVRDFIFENKEYFCGISLLAMSGDLDYKNAPFTTVHTPSEIVKEYGDASVMASGVICAALEAYDNDLWDACNDVIYNKEIEFEKQLKECYNKNLEQKIKWIKQAKRFADKYIEGDYKRMTYLLKDVCNWKLFLDLKRQWQPIPWDDATEDEEVEVDIDTLGAISCNGGQCELNI